MMESKRILMLAGGSDTSAIVYNYLKNKFNIVGVVVEKEKSFSQRVKAKGKFIKWRIKHLGLPTVIGQLLFSTLIDYPLRRTSKRRKSEILNSNNLTDAPVDEKNLIYVEKHNSDETVEIIRNLRPDIIIVNGTGILRSKLLDSVDAPFINTHLGITPMYRGVHGMYWALVNDDKDNAGVTVHFVDKGVDTGGIILQARAVGTDSDNFATYPYLQIAEGVKILAQAIVDVLEGKTSHLTPTGPSIQRYHPTLFQYLKNRFLKGIK